MRRCFAFVLLCIVALAANRARGEEEEDSVRVFRELQPSVVSLQNAEGSGTGIILDASGLILTNAHVVISPLPFKCVVDVVSKPGETRQVEFKKVQIVGYHPQHDLALVRVDPREAGVTLEPAIIARTKPSPGQHIFVIGNPAGGGIVLSKTITAGMLSAVDREIDGEHYDQIDAAINPGNSGGPVADRSGHVLGVVTLKFTDAEAIGFAIPIQDLKTNEFVPLSQKTANPQRSKELIALARQFADLARKAGTPHLVRVRQPGLPGTRVVQQPGDDKARLVYTYYAAVCYRLALLRDPANADLWFDVANTLSIVKDNDVAAAYMLRHIQMGPWAYPAAESYRELGVMLTDLKRMDDAIASLQEGIAKSPYNGRMWYDLALAQKAKNDNATAAYSASVAVVAGVIGVPSNKVSLLITEVRKNLSDSDLKDLDSRIMSETVHAKLDKLLSESNHARQQHVVYMTPAFAKYAQANDGPVLAGVKDNIPQTVLTATTPLGGAPAVQAAAPGGGTTVAPATPLAITPALSALRDGNFTKPKESTAPTTYLKAISTPGDFIGQGQAINLEGPVTLKSGGQGIEARVGPWTLHFAAPRGQSLAVGEYLDATRWPFNQAGPGLDISGNGRGSNQVSGKFVIWELKIEDGKVTHLAIDFFYRSEVSRPPLYGMLRYNSSMQ